MNEVYEMLKKCGIYYLATLQDGRPRLRPFGTIDLFEDKLYIQTGKCKAVADQLKADPRVELCAMGGGKWIRVTAEAVLDERNEPQEHLLAAHPMLQKDYQAGDGNTEVYYLTNVTAEINSHGGTEKVIRF